MNSLMNIPIACSSPLTMFYSCCMNNVTYIALALYIIRSSLVPFLPCTHSSLAILPAPHLSLATLASLLGEEWLGFDELSHRNPPCREILHCSLSTSKPQTRRQQIALLTTNRVDRWIDRQTDRQTDRQIDR